MTFELDTGTIDALRMLTRRINRIEYDVRGLARQSGAAFQSIETDDGAVVMYDVDGNEIGSIGSDGGFTQNTTVYGPPTPETPDVTSGYNSLIITYDGTFTDGDWDENNVSHVEIHVTALDTDPLDDANQVGTFTSSNGGVFTYPWNALDGGRWVSLVAVTTAGEEGSSSTPVFQVPTPVAPTDGTPPATAPVVTVRGGVKSVVATWDAITNNDPVTYKVFVKSGSAPSVVGTTDLLMTTPQTAVVINRLPSGTAVDHSMTIHVRVIATDEDGDGPASTDASATPITIDTADVTGAAITNGLIQTGAITSALIADGTIATGDIASAQITNALMAVNSITTGNITDGTITTAKIGNLQITAPLIADATITTAKYGAGSVTNTVIADDSVTSAKIVANTIVAADIAANTITASQIAANTITASQIAADTITATQIAANAITSSELNAGAVTANKLNVTVGGGNLVANSSLESWTAGVPTGWTKSGANITLSAVAGWLDGFAARCTYTTVGNDGTNRLVTPGVIAPSVLYSISFMARRQSGTGNLQVGCDNWGLPIYTAVLSSGWGQYSFTGASSASAASQLYFLGTVAGDVIDIDRVQVEYGDVPTAWAPKADELLPGTIVANMISAGTITANEIASHTITATQIAAGTITAAEIAAGTITTSKLMITNLTNLLDDPGFENGGAGWNLSTAATVVTTGSPQNGGSKILRFASTGTILDVLAQPISVVPGEVYYASGWIRKTTTGTTGNVSLGATLNLDGGSNQFPQFDAAGMGALTQNVWMLLQGRIVIPSGINTLYLRPSVRNDVPAGETIEMDNFTLRKAISGELIVDGAITAAKVAAGAITANSLSVLVGGGNLLNNSSYEAPVLFMGAPDDQGWSGSFGARAAPTYETSDRYTGTRSVKVYRATNGDGTAWVFPTFTAVAGDVFTFSVYVKAVAGTQDPLQWTINQATASYIVTSIATATPSAAVSKSVGNGWYRVSRTYTVSGAGNLRVFLGNSNDTTANDTDFLVDAAQVERGDVLTAYSPKPDEILPGTIVATMVATDTLTANEIATNAITTNEIAANTITAGDIAASTITTAEIAANTITASDISAHTITATEISAHTITATEIAADTITATQIAANTITASQIAANTITGTQLSATAIDAMTITGAVYQTVSNLGTASVVGMRIENDASGGVIKFWNGLGSETPGSLNPASEVSTGQPYVAITASKDAATWTQTGILKVYSGQASLPARVVVKVSHASSSEALAVVNGSNVDVFSVTSSGMVFTNDNISGGGALDISQGITAGLSIVATNDIRGARVLATAPDSSTSGTNVHWASGGQYQVITSLAKNKKFIKKISLARTKSLLDIPLVDWYDRFEMEANQGSIKGLRRIPGVVAESVEAVDPTFATYDGDGNLLGVQYDRLALAWIPLVKDLYAQIDELKKNPARN